MGRPTMRWSRCTWFLPVAEVRGSRPEQYATH
jgi:hypothetical protein